MRLRIIVLTALFALAGGVQALVPASAVAMDDSSPVGACEAADWVPFLGVGWNGSGFCPLDGGDGSGAGDGGGGASGDDIGGALGEVIEIEDSVVRDDPCVNDYALCLASQQSNAGSEGRRSEPDSESRPRRLSANAERRRLQISLCRANRGLLKKLEARRVIIYREELADFQAEPVFHQSFKRRPDLEARIGLVQRELRAWFADGCLDLGLQPRW